MTSIATAANLYARPAIGTGEVSPVRAPRRAVDSETARRQDTEFAAKRHGEPPRSETQTSPGASVNVVELPIANEGRVQPTQPARRAQPFVPFLAQQLAQEDPPQKSPRTDRAGTAQAVTDAYILASDDAATILGPVRPRQLVV